MATYFAADHVVWAHQIGLLPDKKLGERSQKVSLWSWALGSVCTMVLEASAILRVGAGSQHSHRGPVLLWQLREDSLQWSCSQACTACSHWPELPSLRCTRHPQRHILGHEYMALTCSVAGTPPADRIEGLLLLPPRSTARR